MPILFRLAASLVAVYAAIPLDENDGVNKRRRVTDSSAEDLSGCVDSPVSWEDAVRWFESSTVDSLDYWVPDLTLSIFQSVVKFLSLAPPTMRQITHPRCCNAYPVSTIPYSYNPVIGL